MRHISLFEVLAGRIEDFTGVRGKKLDSSFRPVERNIILQGRYEQIDDIEGGIAGGRSLPNIWRSIDNYDGFYYVPDELPEDKGSAKWDPSLFPEGGRGNGWGNSQFPPGVMF